MRQIFLSRPKSSKDHRIFSTKTRHQDILYDYEVIARIVNGVASKISEELRLIISEVRLIDTPTHSTLSTSTTTTIKRPAIRTDIDVAMHVPDDTKTLQTNLEQGGALETGIDDIGDSVDKLTKIK